METADALARAMWSTEALLLPTEELIMGHVFKEKFLNDVDGDGCPIPNTTPFFNIGRVPDVQMAQGLLADVKCQHCGPNLGLYTPITWAAEAREMVTTADRAMDIGAKGDLIRAMQDCANINHDGITRLSDSSFPDAYFGWKS